MPADTALAWKTPPPEPFWEPSTAAKIGHEKSPCLTRGLFIIFSIKCMIVHTNFLRKKHAGKLKWIPRYDSITKLIWDFPPNTKHYVSSIEN